MGTFLSIVGLIASILMIKYREKVGDNIGQADWMQKVGGVYNFIIIVSIFIFFWSIAHLTGTTNFFFSPFRTAIEDVATPGQ